MRKRDLIAAAAGALTATVLAGGVAWAAIPGDGGVIRGCYTKVGGVVRVVDTAKGQACLPNLEVPLSWNQQGPKGEPGVNGGTGASGVSPAVAQLGPGDANCPAGGAALTDASGHTAYVCNGQAGAGGQSFAGSFTSPNGEYSIAVTDTGITIAHGPLNSMTLAGDDFNVRSAGSATVRAGTTATIESGNSLSLTTDGSALLQAHGPLNLRGSVISMN